MERTRGTARRELRRRRMVAAGLVAVALGATIAVVTSGRPGAVKRGTPTTRHSAGVSTTGPATTRRPARVIPAVERSYHEVVFATLGHAVAAPVAGVVGGRVVFAAGLDATSTSTARVGAIAGNTIHTLSSLPAALHDAAGAVLGDSLYVFGGGNAVGELNSILRVDGTCEARAVGQLPARSSDSSAATIGSRAYLVGGYDGSRWLDTVVAYDPAHGARVVAHLPVGLRYAATASIAGRIVIAGGTTSSARATTAIFVFNPRTGTVAKLGDLPRPLSHASAVTVGDRVLVVGGQDATRQPQPAIVTIDARTGRVREAGALALARSDAALVNANGRIVIIGGKTSSATLDTVSELVADPTAPGVSVYAHTGARSLSREAARARPLVYVPNSKSNTVDVIDPATYKVIDHFAVGALPQHVTPAWDFKTLYVDNDHGNTLTPLDPRTGKRRGPDLAVTDPYNLYFTIDGRFAIVVAEARQRLDFRDAHTMQLVNSVAVPCRGVDHMDYTADGTLALASCEFSGQMIVIDLRRQTVERTINLPSRGRKPRPQDVKISPDGSVFYVADMNSSGLWEIDAQTFTVIGFLPTGAGAHGLYPSRDARNLYVTNRDAGTVSVVDFATRAIVRTWTIPGGSPDMGGVSADGNVLWLSGRYSGVVYAISTRDGGVIATIRVGSGPHGLCVWPQPGRFSIGHTGITR